MKTCLCCLQAHSDDAPTCPSCGEGSWAPIETGAAPPPVDNDHLEPGAEPFSPETVMANAPTEPAEPRGRSGRPSSKPR